MPHTSAPQQKAAVLRRFGLHVWTRPQRAWGTSDSLVPIRVRKLLTPVPTPPAIWAVGVNYKGQLAEMGVERSKNPLAFMQNPAAAQNPFDPVVIPPVAAGECDFEVELAVVIGVDSHGRLCKDVSPDAALDYVHGYTVANDIGARRWQGRKGGGQWSRAKSFDSFLPLGPAIVSPAAIPDPQQNVRLSLRVNGTVMQDAPTSDMLFPVKDIIAFLSQGTTLLPGTVILTGTPAGVGFVRNPPVYLRAGDEMCAQVEGIGCLFNTVIEK